MPRTSDFDVVVLGGGTAGLTAALAARSAGASVALVERESRLGGDCAFYGCVPSKALIEIARLAFELRRAAAEGVFAHEPPLDFPAVCRRRARIVDEIAQDERDERFHGVGIEIVRGQAELVGPNELQVESRVLRARRLVIATGSEPAVPELPGLDRVSFHTSRTIFELEQLPRRLLVLGGGPTGLELAQAFSRFGSAVAVVEAAESLLPRDEPEAGSLLTELLREEGVELHLGVTAESVAGAGDEIALRLADEKLRGDVLLVAAGRRARTRGFGLEHLELDTTDGYLDVDRRCRTSLPHVYAAGDVIGGPQFTHLAAHQGRVAGLNAAGKRARRDERVLPWVTYTDPEIAHVGLTEAQARERHRDVAVEMRAMTSVDRARIVERRAGFVKLVTAGRPLLGRLGGGRLVGAEIVGPGAGELIHECALAIRTRVFAGRLAQLIHAYPSMSVAVQQTEAQSFPGARALVE